MGTTRRVARWVWMAHTAAILVCGGVAWLPVAATAQSGIPEGFPLEGQFAANYFKNEYLVPVAAVDGAQYAGDLSATYHQVVIPVVDGREILVIGEYPRARYFSLVLYDTHGAIIRALRDSEIAPLRATDQNPFVVGGPAGAEDQLYAVTMRLGETTAQAPDPACAFDGVDVHGNLLDARFNHMANGYYSCQMSNFSVDFGNSLILPHDDSTQNTGAVLMLRQYLPEEPAADSQFDLRVPLVFIRDSQSGCGVPVAPPGTLLLPEQWIPGGTVTDFRQVILHMEHTRRLGTGAPDGVDPFNGLYWSGSAEYILRSLEERYVSGRVPSDKRAADLNAQGRVMRLRFRVPSTPEPGCRACPFTGDEEVRYWGMSFAGMDNRTVASISDLDLKVSGRGYATLIVSFGTPLPTWVTPAVNYSVLTLPPTDIKHLTLRNLAPAAGFACSTNNVPASTHEYHSAGGYMGEYLPIVDYPVAADLPKWAIPIETIGGSCANPVPPPDPCG